MAINRATIAVHLHTQFETLAREINQPATTDSASGYGPDIDAALRRLGKTTDELATATVEEGDVEACYALAEYYALRRFWRKLATKVNVGAAALAPEGNRQNVFENVGTLLKMAAETVEAFGYNLGDDTAWEFVRLGLDFIEPVVSE